MRTVSMLDLKAEYDLFRDEIRDVVDSVLESQQFINGPAVAEFEQAVAARIGVGSAVALSNGSDALVCALMALGIGRDDEVIVPAFTFLATAASVVRVGAIPVFVDVDPRTFNIDPAAIRQAVTPRTRAVIPVHLFGQCADMDAVDAIAREHGLHVVEDAAQAIGASYRGRPAGTMGAMATFSFYPTKNLGGFGEGGMITTNDAALADVVRQIRNQGESTRYHHERIGGNFRLDTMKAAILSVKLKRLEEFNAKRRRNAATYDRRLSPTAVQTPAVADGCTHVYHQYSILCEDRDGLIAFLRDRGVSTGVYYPKGLHQQACFVSLFRDERTLPGSLPVTERVCSQIVSLPCHPMLSPDDVAYVAECVSEYVVAAAAHAPAGPARGRADGSDRPLSTVPSSARKP